MTYYGRIFPKAESQTLIQHASMSAIIHLPVCDYTVCMTHHALWTGSWGRRHSRRRWSGEAWLVQWWSGKSFCISLWQRIFHRLMLDVCRKTTLKSLLWDTAGHLLYRSICMRGHSRCRSKCGMCPLSKTMHSLLIQILGIWIAGWVYALGLHRQCVVGCICHRIPNLGWHGMAKVWRIARKSRHRWHHRGWHVRGRDERLGHAHSHGEHVCQGKKWWRLRRPYGGHMRGHGIAISSGASGIGDMTARGSRRELGGVIGEVWRWRMSGLGGARVWWIHVGKLSRGGHNCHRKLLHVAKIWKGHGVIGGVWRMECPWSSWKKKTINKNKLNDCVLKCNHLLNCFFVCV